MHLGLVGEPHRTDRLERDWYIGSERRRESSVHRGLGFSAQRGDTAGICAVNVGIARLNSIMDLQLRGDMADALQRILVRSGVAAGDVGALLLRLVAWLGQHDVARKFIYGTGLSCFSAAALLGGYFWLASTALIWMVAGYQSAGFSYDALVHSVMLGFAMSMIMAHAPIIFAAIIRRPIPCNVVMWVPLALLHLGLVMRILLGDLLKQTVVWQTGGVITLVALLVFIFTMVTVFIMVNRQQTAPKAILRIERK